MTTYSRLTREQRYTIDSMRRNGCLQKEIAAAIGVAPSTFSRELRRGGMSRGSYCLVAALRPAAVGKKICAPGHARYRGVDDRPEM